MMKILGVVILLVNGMYLFGQTKLSISGEYTLVQEIGIQSEVLPTGNGQSQLAKISVDTTITQTLIFDTLHVVHLLIDTIFGFYSDIPVTNMKGEWYVKNDSILVRFDSIAIIYGYFLEVKSNTYYKKINSSIILCFKALVYNGYPSYVDEVYAVILSNEERDWMKFRKK